MLSEGDRGRYGVDEKFFDILSRNCTFFYAQQEVLIWSLLKRTAEMFHNRNVMCENFPQNFVPQQTDDDDNNETTTTTTTTSLRLLLFFS